VYAKEKTYSPSRRSRTMQDRTPKEYPLPVQNEQIESLPRSLTEKILSLCGNRRFGVREAIAEATKHERAVPATSRRRTGRIRA